VTNAPIDDPWMDRLSAAVDDELTPDERVLLDAHLAECAGCRATLAELRAVVSEARALPDRPPEEDLWPAVEARIAAFARSEAALEHAEVAGQAAYAPPAIPVVGRRPGRGRGLTLTWPQLVAAGLTLVALSGGGVWVGLHRGTLGTGIHLFGGSRGGAPTGAEFTASTPAAESGDPAYAREVAELERTLAERRGQLDPTTVKTIESNLHIIDLAAAQAREALAADPSNPYLKDYLSRTMQRKVDVLKQATVFASTR
jgi:putative zinc finger protein